MIEKAGGGFRGVPAGFCGVLRFRVLSLLWVASNRYQKRQGLQKPEAGVRCGIGKGVTQRRQIEIELRRWLRTHYSVIGYREALDLGATPPLIRSKHDRGEWDRPCRGVYRDTAAPRTSYQDTRVACVATGPASVASHASAAWLWGLLDRPPDTVEVTVTEYRGARHRLITIHRSRDLMLAEAVNWKNIPVTRPMRTLVDLAGTASPRDLVAAVDRALARQLVTVAGLEAEIGRLSRQGRDGVGVLRRQLEEQGFTGAPAPSVLEAHARRLIVRTNLPTPVVEQRVGTDLADYRVDVCWADILLIVEVDGYVWHFSPEQKERDDTRRNELRRLGWTVLVYNWRQVVRDQDRVARQIVDAYRARSLASPRGGGPG